MAGKTNFGKITLEQHNTIVANYENNILKITRKMTDFFAQCDNLDLLPLISQWEEHLKNILEDFKNLANKNRARIIES